MRKNAGYILVFFVSAIFGGVAYLLIKLKTATKTTTTTNPNLGNSAWQTTISSKEIEDIKKRLVKLEDNFEE